MTPFQLAIHSFSFFSFLTALYHSELYTHPTFLFCLQCHQQGITYTEQSLIRPKLAEVNLFLILATKKSSGMTKLKQR